MNAGKELELIRSRHRTLLLICCWMSSVIFQTTGAIAQQSQGEQLELFESRIRPALIEHCYPCHNSVEHAEADYAVDWRKGVQAKTEHGTGVIPGQPEESLLIKVIEHQIDDLKMPEGRAKLPPALIQDFKTWIAAGAVDPRDQPPTTSEFDAATSWEATLAQRKKWWSLQPIQRPELPPENDWSNHPVDRFIHAAAASNGLTPGTRADPETLTRRLSYVLTGLPPTAEQIQMASPAAESFDRQVESFLASSHYGERWARHWMDVVRYADSHGSEGDPAIPNAFQYRDYLIRAFNADVPYDQLVREHIAGDLIENPRINEALGVNESMFGTAHWRFCFHGFAPTDALDEKVRFTDDQINVLGKAFMGLTISCARCHDHKFDAISQADYYAMFGIVGSCRPAMKNALTKERQLQYLPELKTIKAQIRSKLVRTWMRQIFQMTDHSVATKLTANVNPEEARQVQHPLYPLQILQDEVKAGAEFTSSWSRLVEQWKQDQTVEPSPGDLEYWNLANSVDFEQWFSTGNGSLAPAKPGAFAVSLDGEIAVDAIYPGGVFTHLVSNQQRGVLGSPRFLIQDDTSVWIRLVGGGQSTVRYAVQNYPRSGTVYPINDIDRRDWDWYRFDLKYWQGDQVHIELATAKDAPVQVRNRDRSWFGIRDVVVRKNALGPPKVSKLDHLSPVFDVAAKSSPNSPADLARCYVAATSQAIQDWQQGTITDRQALFLNSLLQAGVLVNDLKSLPDVAQAVKEYRALESVLPKPVRVPGLMEADAFDQPLFARGDHRKPQAPIQRRFLEAIDPSPYQTDQSGRLELANDLFRKDNPLTSRVIVNRIWQHLFGEGLVATPDNFGQLGSPPSHPELLDFLATKMIEQHWSIKDMVRFIVSSQTWQQTSLESELARKRDPDNRLLSHANIRRLDGESIRDALLEVAGQLQDEMFGPGFPANSNIARRSVYVRSDRNNLDEFLAVFDSPIPFSTTGRRSVTNVPAQSLALLNSPFVVELSNQWAQRIRRQEDLSPDKQVSAMFVAAMGRKPLPQELAALLKYRELAADARLSRERQLTRFKSEVESANRQIEKILSPVRQRLSKRKLASSETAESPAPLAQWRFSQGLVDLRGQLKLELKSGARIDEGSLVLDGNGWALSPPLPHGIGPRTLEAWVQLDDYRQKGGGVVTIQRPDGHLFDSIVYAELQDGQWLAGSEFHKRTLPFGGEQEVSAVDQPVHIAIVYAPDGKIIGYRNGLPYGKSIRKSELQRFERVQIALGIRHGTTTTPGRMLTGRIFEVRVYDRALGPDEIAASFGGQPVVSLNEIVNRLDSKEKSDLDRLRELIDDRQAKLKQLNSVVGPTDALARVAHAIFNLKEFIYLR